MTQILRKSIAYLESGFDQIFGADLNPLYHLGALGWFCFWIVTVSGIYLFIFFDTGITDAYSSVEYMTHQQWYAAGIMRSLHRYASDALVVIMILHLLREYLLDRLRGPRWFAWITGVVLIWLVFAAGISGYWVVWDQLAQYIAISTSEWLDALPIFSEPIARNFLHSGTLSSRFFTLLVFVHIAVPLVLLFFMWIHIQRHMQPKVNPPKGLAFGSLAMMLALSIYKPALSQGPVDLDRVPGLIELDWFYLLPLPMADIYGGAVVWLVIGSASLLLLVLPWLPWRKAATAAVVDLDNCNGCGRCAADCPYSAVSMQPRSDGSAYSLEAVVSEDLCIACGICVGACPTATPFRRLTELKPGIELPGSLLTQLREQLHEKTDALSAQQKLVVFTCQFSAAASQADSDELAVLSMPCIGMLPPSFIDYCLSRQSVDGVVVAGCREGDCEYRLGQDWVNQRIAGQRDPYLRARVDRGRLRVIWSGIDQLSSFAKKIAEFKLSLKQQPKRAKNRRRTDEVQSHDG